MGLPCRTVWDFKEAAFDKGAERVDAVRAMMASRLPRTHERLSDLASGVTLNGLASARDERLEQLRSAVVASSRIIHGTGERLTGLSDAVHWNITKEATLENVRTLGIGLLDRTEAILEVLLPRSSGFGTSSSSSSSGLSPSEEEWQRMLDRLGKVPRPISVEEVRTFAVRVSSSATLRFTVVCTQNSASLVQHLQRADIRRILQRIHWTEAQQALKEAARVRSGDAIATASVRVAQAAYVSCEELLGERFALRAFGHVAHVWRSSRASEAAESADDQSEQKPSVPAVTQARASVKDQAASPATPTPSSPSSPRRSRSPSRDREGPQLRLIIKNSFLEFDEEPEEGAKNWLRTKRRCRSLDLNGPSMRLGAYEPYVLTVDCFSGDGAGGSSASQAEPSSRPRYAPAAERGRSSSRGRSNSHARNEQGPPPALEPEGSLGSSAAAPAVPSPRSEACPCPAPEPNSRVSAPQREEGADVSQGASDTEEPKATVLVRNLPKDAVWRDLTERLDALGFACKYEFAYLPRDFTHGVGLGYALVGMQTIEYGEALIRSLDGATSWAPDGGEALRATWSDPQRTITEHVERYRNSPVMHSSIPDDYKPALFRQGARVPFPAPTKALRPPRIRQNKVLAHNPHKNPQVPVAAK